MTRDEMAARLEEISTCAKMAATMIREEQPHQYAIDTIDECVSFQGNTLEQIQEALIDLQDESNEAEEEV